MKTQRLVRAAMPVLVVAGLVLSAAGAAAAFELADTVWPMFQHDQRHTGQSDLLGPLFPSGAPGAGDVLSWQGFDKIKSSPTIGPDGTIYVALNFDLCAINPDMTQKWCTLLRADVSPSSVAVGFDPATSKYTLYVGDRDNTLTAFDPDTGAKLWLYNNGFEGDINTSPAIGADGTVYFAFAQNKDGAGVVTALTPGDTPHGGGLLKWKEVLGNFVDTSSPAIDLSTGGIFLGDVKGNLYKLQDAICRTPPAVPKATRVCWKTSVGTKITASPVIGTDGTVFIGSDKGMTAVRPTDGHILWTFTTAGMVDQTAALGANGVLYFGAKTGPNKTIYAVGTDGVLRWKYGPVPVYADLGGFPMLGGDGILYMGLSNGVTAFSPDGAVLWTYNTGNAVLSFPAIGGNAGKEDGGTAILYLGSSDWKLYAISSQRHGKNGNHAPTVVGPDDQGATVGQVLTFSAGQSVDEDGDVLSFRWDFDDGTTSSGPTVTHAYLTTGLRHVTLTVSDGLEESSVQFAVNVVAGGPLDFSDDFNRASADPLDNGWQVPQGHLVVSANEVKNAPLAANHIAVRPTMNGLKHSAAASFASVDNNPAPRLGVVLRFQDAQNYYVFYRQAGGTNALRISKVVNGVETVLATVSVPGPALNTFFRIDGAAVPCAQAVPSCGAAPGARLTLKLDNVQKLTVVDPTFQGGSVGVLVGSGSTAVKQYRADNFSAHVE